MECRKSYQPVEERKKRQHPSLCPVSISQEVDEDLRQHHEVRHDWIEQLGAQDRHVTSRGYHRIADLRVGTTDPDADEKWGGYGLSHAVCG